MNISTLFALVLFVLIEGVLSRKSSTKLNGESPFVEIFGDHLNFWNKNGELDTGYTETLLKNKDVVGIYFSAGWCGPCRQFTPILSQFYNEMKKKGKKFEIVFVSQDRSEDDFVNYYSKMPWLALPIDSLDSHLQQLADSYGLKGIPHFVLLDGYDASVYTLDGRSKILNDKYGLEFPYRPRTPLNLIPRSIKNGVNGLFARIVDLIKGILTRIKDIALASITKAIGVVGATIMKVLEKIVPQFILKLFRR